MTDQGCSHLRKRQHGNGLDCAMDAKVVHRALASALVASAILRLPAFATTPASPPFLVSL